MNNKVLPNFNPRNTQVFTFFPFLILAEFEAKIADIEVEYGQLHSSLCILTNRPCN